MSSLQKAEQANVLYSKLVELLRVGRMTGIIAGETLWRLKANNLYKEAVGQGIDSWIDFLKQPEIGLDVREATRAMDLYETFVVKYGYSIEDLASAKTKSLHYLLPLAKSETVPTDRIHELVEDAKHLSQNQFRENIYDAKTQDVGARTYQFVLMRKCNETGTLQRVQDIDNDKIKEAFLKVGIVLEDKSLPEIL